MLKTIKVIFKKIFNLYFSLDELFLILFINISKTNVYI